MGEGYQQFLEGNYDSGKEEEQSKKDVAQAQRIYRVAQGMEAERRTDIINTFLGNEIIPSGDEEAIRELFNDCAQDKNAYLVDGAILTCNMAYTQPQALRSVLYGTELKNGEKNVSQTLLKIPETNSYINGMPVATVKDHAIDTNIEPFKCNCLNIPDREEEWKAIESSEECKKYGTCQKLMCLEDDWENIISSTLYLSFNHSIDGQETERAQGVTINSMLFCRHGGLITPLWSGQNILSQYEIQKFINIALNEADLGITEKMVQIGDDLIGTNEVLYNNWFYNEVTLEPWCAVFVCWCANKAGILDTRIPRTASCEQMKAGFEARGTYHSAKDYIPRAGDVFIHLYGNGKGHTGIVIAYDPINNEVYTVEGNSEDKVKKNVRTYDGYFDGFGSSGGNDYGIIPEGFGPASSNDR